MSYKLSKNNVGRPSSFTTEHESYIRELLDKDPQFFLKILLVSYLEFVGFSISKTQLNHHLKNNVLVTIKKITFEPEARNSADSLEMRYEWFMKWKDSDEDFTNDYIFIDEAGFHINLRNNCRADTGTPVVVKTTKTKTPSYTIIGAIHSSSIIHVAIKKPPPKKEKLQSNKASTSKKRKVAKGKKHIIDEFIIEEPATEYVDDNNEGNAQDSSELISKGTTTAHFIKLINVLLDIMDLNEDLKESYLVMNNCTIHKSKPMMRKIESFGYKLMYLSLYSPELNLIEQFWAILKGKLKCHKLLTEEKMSDRIAEACNTIPSEILYNFASHSERQSIQCYNKTPF